MSSNQSNPVYYPGGTVSNQYTFTDENGSLYDPTSAVITITDSAGNVQANLTLSDMSRTSVGVYQLLYNLPGNALTGIWIIHMQAFYNTLQPVQVFGFVVAAPSIQPQNQLQNFTSLPEVISHLNATGPDDNNNYTVHGLTVAAATVQAHVDYANKYLYSLAPNLTDTSDIRYTSAQLAALDIACLEVLVTVVGGSLVGAYDYSLGDLRVSRAGPYAFAIKAAIEGYRQSAQANLQNVTSPVASASAKLADRVPMRHWFRWPLS